MTILPTQALCAILMGSKSAEVKALAARAKKVAALSGKLAERLSAIIDPMAARYVARSPYRNNRTATRTKLCNYSNKLERPR